MVELLDTPHKQVQVGVCMLGSLIIILGVLRHFLNTKLPASTVMVAMLVGIIFGPHVLNLVDVRSWGDSNAIVYEINRLVVSVQLISTALSIPFRYLRKAWKAQLVLIFLVTTLMWLCSGLLVYLFFLIPLGYSFTAWEALLIGACIAPTDPVVAGAAATSTLAVRVVPGRVRHTVAAESSFNDGLGYPIVALCMAFVDRHRRGLSVSDTISHWVSKDFFWEVVFGTVVGIVVGYVIGKLLKWAEPSKLHDQQLLVALTVGLAFGWSGMSTLLGLDGFLLIFVGGIVYSKVVEGEKRDEESQLQETVDLMFSTTAFVLFGLVIPFDQWHNIGWWRGVLLALSVVVFRRMPWVGLVHPFLKPQIRSIDENLFLGYFGPIGVGAIFFAQIALSATDLEPIWVVVTFIVFTQIAIFGLTDTALLIWYGDRNRTYRERRQWKIDVLAQAETEKRQIRRAALKVIRSAPPGSPPALSVGTAQFDTQTVEIEMDRVDAPTTPASSSGPFSDVIFPAGEEEFYTRERGEEEFSTRERDEEERREIEEEITSN